MGFNPADYATVKNTAKEMSKPDLESYYVQRKDAQHPGPGWIIYLIVVIAMVIFMIGFLGYAKAIDNFVEDMQEVSVQVADEVCPISDDIYVSVNLKSIKSDFEIDCLNYRHK